MHPNSRLAIVLAAAFLCLTDPAAAQSTLPVVPVTTDNTQITKSCIIEIPQDAVIVDADNNGVIHITKPGIRVIFRQATELWGGPRPESPLVGNWDTYSGIGIRLDGVKGVTIRGANIHGFKVGIWATNCPDLRIENADLSDNFRQRLKSTPEAEDTADWLSPHHNDNDEWATRYGAGLYLRGCSWPTIFGVRARRGQNGILLHTVRDGLIYDNDCSFLSGWGLGMFRTTGCTVSRNAFDYCVRGHSEGIYNRGQDSAGILMFEQCSSNLILENSCTHSGDGIFGFAGLEAVNGEGAPPDFDFKRKGCNDNTFAGNDLSFAPAHGLEMTFSFGNTIISNRFVGNAICGIWGGYSQDSLIARNEFLGNGGMAYGLERGAINIEHGSANLIFANEFMNNLCAVHLWWDPHGDFDTKAWGKANSRGVQDNVVIGNVITINSRQPFGLHRKGRPLVGLHIRDDAAQPHVLGTVFARNVVTIDPAIGVERIIPAGAQLIEERADPLPPIPTNKPSGTTSPVGARRDFAGRERIIMGEWGPWDFISPLARLRSTDNGTHKYEVYGTGGDLAVSSDDPADTSAIATTQNAQQKYQPGTISVIPTGSAGGVFPYSFTAHTGAFKVPIRGVIVRADWQLAVFAWDDSTDPRTQLEAWRALATGESTLHAMSHSIDFNYGSGGPRDQDWSAHAREDAPGPDHFGMIARTRLKLTAGKWRISTTSDDGVRVLTDGKPIIENWTWHGPTGESGILELAEPREVELVVEHFEIDGHAVLKLEIAPAP